MNLRCIYCQTPFTLARAEMLGAIIVMNEKHQSHYDAHCPRCRRANSISRQSMELHYPNWQDAAKHASNLDEAPPPPTPEPVSATSKTEPLAREEKAAPVKKAASPKPKTPAAKKTTAAKPATSKKAPAKGKK